MVVGRRLAALSAAGGAYCALKSVSGRRKEADATEVGSLDEALPLVQHVGFAVVRNCVSSTELGRCRATEAYQSMPTSAASDPTDVWRLSSFGRFHRAKFDDADVMVFTELEQSFMPFVEAFFEREDRAGDRQEHGGGAMHPVDRSSAAGGDRVTTASGSRRNRIFRSELQLLNATPVVSQEQMWHSDNRTRGVTVVVPLVDFSIENGATELLPGSHAFTTGAWRLLLREGPRVVTPRVGSIALYDARTYHRGLGNSTSESRPALVFRYDRLDSPPPGVGVVGSLTHATIASALHTISSATTALCNAAR